MSILSHIKSSRFTGVYQGIQPLRNLNLHLLLQPLFCWPKSAKKASFYIMCTFYILAVSVEVFADMAVVVVDVAGAGT